MFDFNNIEKDDIDFDESTINSSLDSATLSSKSSGNYNNYLKRNTIISYSTPNPDASINPISKSSVLKQDFTMTIL